MMLVHAAQFLFFIAALVTGFLLFSPTLRSAITSGYSALIKEAHRYGGRAHILLVLALVALWAWSRIKLPGFVIDRWQLWRMAHVALIGLAAVGLGATGFVLSARNSFSLTLFDYSFTTHLMLTYLSCAIIATHVFLTIRHPEHRVLFGGSNAKTGAEPSTIAIGRTPAESSHAGKES